MINIIQNELMKLWTRKFFWGTLLLLSAVNVLLLWYTESSKADAAPPSAYVKMAADIKHLPESEKANFIEEKLKMLMAVDAMTQLSIIGAAEEGEYSERFITQIKEGNPDMEDYRTVFESGAYLKYTTSLESEMAFVSEIHAEIMLSASYPERLEDIEKQAKKLSQVSIFGGENADGFSGRNIEKTAEAFKAMEGVRIQYGVSKGFVAATGFLGTDVIAIILMFLFGALLIYDEKDKGLFALIKATPSGRGYTAAAKIIVLAINMAVVTLVLFGVNLLYAKLLYGLPDLSASLQSVPQFLNSTLSFSVGQYLALFLVSKFFAYFTLSMLVFIAAVLLKHPFIAYAVTGGVFLTGFVLYQTISPVSKWNMFKYINLISFVRTNGLYQDYLNLNLFEHPVNLIPLIWITLIFVFVVLLICSFWSFCMKKEMQTGQLPFVGFLRNIALFKYRPSSSIFRHECYKLLIVGKVALLFALFVLFQWYGSRNDTIRYAYDEPFYRNYMSILSGELTPDKEDYIEQEQSRYDDAEKSLEKIGHLVQSGQMTQEQAGAAAMSFYKILAGKPMFEKVLMHYDYIKEHSKAEFVYDTGYNHLFGVIPNNDGASALMLILICIICFSSLFPMESKAGALQLIGTTVLGKSHTFICKMLVCMVALIPFFVTVYLPRFWLLKDTFHSLNAPAMSLPFFSHIPAFIPIWGCITLLYLIRFAACIIVMLAVLAISKISKTGVTAMMVSSFVFVVPVVLWMMNIKFIYPLTMLPPLTAGGIFMGEFNLLPAALFTVLYVGIAVWGVLVNMGFERRSKK